MIDYIAVVGHGSWGGASKVHAAIPGSGVRVKYDHADRYVSRCGIKYLTTYTHGDGSSAHPRRVLAFRETFHIEQCQRCARLINRETATEGDDAR